jgi:hypothetical protein
LTTPFTKGVHDTPYLVLILVAVHIARAYARYWTQHPVQADSIGVLLVNLYDDVYGEYVQWEDVLPVFALLASRLPESTHVDNVALSFDPNNRSHEETPPQHVAGLSAFFPPSMQSTDDFLRTLSDSGEEEEEEEEDDMMPIA